MILRKNMHFADGAVTLLLFGALALCALTVGGGLWALGLLGPRGALLLALAALAGGAAAAGRGDRPLEDAVLELVSPARGGGGA